MFRQAAVFLALLLGAALAVPLRIAFTGYVHGGITSVAGGRFCVLRGLNDTLPGSACSGGCDRRQKFFETMKEEDPDTVIADLGNYYWGSIYYTVYDKNPGLDCFIRAKYDVSAIGGSDMYTGIKTYSDFVSEVVSETNTTFIATNVGFAANATTPLAGTVQRSWIKTLSNGLKVGFISPLSPYYTTTLTIDSGEFEINPELSTANHLRQEIFRLRAEGARTIVLMTEITRDFDTSLFLARELEHVSIVLACRSPVPSYSKIIKNIHGEDLLVVSLAAEYGTQVGWIEAELNNDGSFADIAEAQRASSPIDITSSFPFDEEMRSIITSTYDLASDPVFVGVIGESYRPIDGREGTLMAPDSYGCRTASCPMGRLILDAMLHLCPDKHGCIALLNAGSIRASITYPDGMSEGNVPVRASSVYEALPFFNTLVKMELTGATILRAMANSISRFPRESGRFLQTNMRVVFNPNVRTDIEPNDLASRLLEVLVQKNSSGGVVEWTQIDPAAVYTVLLSDYLASGGDDYTMISTSGSEVTELGITFSDVLINFISNQTQSNVASLFSLTAVTDGLLDYPSYEEEGDCLSAATPLPPNSRCMTTYVNQTYNEYHHCSTDLDFCTANQNSLIFGSIWVTPSCDECSGIGICANRRCTCTGSYTTNVPDGSGGVTQVTYAYENGAPLSGTWKGVEMVRGIACSEVRSVWSITNPERSAMYVAAGIAYLVAIAWFCILFYLRSEPVVRASSPLFGMLMCVGAVIATTAIIMDAMKTRTTNTCNASVWLIVIGYTLVFACLFVKTHRIHTIFNAKRLKGRATYTDAKVLLFVGLIAAVNIVVLLVFRFVSPLELSPFAFSNKFAVGESCASDSIAFTIVLFTFNGLLLIWGIYLAVKTRNVDSNFNESKYIGISVYNCFFAALVMILVMYVMANTEPSIAFIIKAWLIMYIACSTLSFMFVPRVMLYFRGVKQLSTDSTLATGMRLSGNGTQHSELEKQNARDRRMIQALMQRVKEGDATVTQLVALLEKNNIPVPNIDVKPTDLEAAAVGSSFSTKSNNGGFTPVPRRPATTHSVNLATTSTGAPVRRPMFANSNKRRDSVMRAQAAAAYAAMIIQPQQKEEDDDEASADQEATTPVTPQEDQGVELQPMSPNPGLPSVRRRPLPPAPEPADDAAAGPSEGAAATEQDAEPEAKSASLPTTAPEPTAPESASELPSEDAQQSPVEAEQETTTPVSDTVPADCAAPDCAAVAAADATAEVPSIVDSVIVPADVPINPGLSSSFVAPSQIASPQHGQRTPLTSGADGTGADGSEPAAPAPGRRGRRYDDDGDEAPLTTNRRRLSPVSTSSRTMPQTPAAAAPNEAATPVRWVVDRRATSRLSLTPGEFDLSKF